MLSFLNKKNNTYRNLGIFLILAILFSPFLFCKKIQRGELNVTSTIVSEALKPGAEITKVVFRHGNTDVPNSNFTLVEGDEVQLSGNSNTAGSSVRLRTNTSLKAREYIEFVVQAKAKSGNQDFNATKKFGITVAPATIVCDLNNNGNIYVGLEVNQEIAKCRLEGEGINLSTSVTYNVVTEGSLDHEAVSFQAGGSLIVKNPEKFKDKTELSVVLSITDANYSWREKIVIPLQSFVISIDEEITGAILNSRHELGKISVNYPEKTFPNVTFSDLEYKYEQTSSWIQSSSNSNPDFQLSIPNNSSNSSNSSNEAVIVAARDLDFQNKPNNTILYFKMKIRVNSNVVLVQEFSFKVLRFLFRSSLTQNSNLNFMHSEVSKNDVVGKFQVYLGADEITNNTPVYSTLSACKYQDHCTNALMVEDHNLVRDENINSEPKIQFNPASEIKIGVGLRYPKNNKEYFFVQKIQPLKINLLTDNLSFPKNKPGHLIGLQLLGSGTTQKTFSVNSIKIYQQNSANESWSDNVNDLTLTVVSVNLQPYLQLQLTNTSVDRFKVKIQASMFLQNHPTNPVHISEEFEFSITDYVVSLVNPDNSDVIWYKSFTARLQTSTTPELKTFLGKLSVEDESSNRQGFDFALTNLPTNQYFEIDTENNLYLKALNTRPIDWTNSYAISVQLVVTPSSSLEPSFIVSFNKKLEEYSDWVIEPVEFLHQSSGPHSLVAVMKSQTMTSVETKLELGKPLSNELLFLDSNQIKLSDNVGEGENKEKSLSDLSQLNLSVENILSIGQNNYLQYHYFKKNNIVIPVKPSNIIYNLAPKDWKVYDKSYAGVLVTPILGVQDEPNNNVSDDFTFSVVDNSQFSITTKELKTNMNCADDEKNVSSNRFTATNNRVKLTIKAVSNNTTGPKKVLFKEVDFPLISVEVKSLDKDDAQGCQDCKGLYKNSLVGTRIGRFVPTENGVSQTSDFNVELVETSAYVTTDTEGYMALKQGTGVKPGYPVWEEQIQNFSTPVLVKKDGLYAKQAQVITQKQPLTVKFGTGKNGFEVVDNGLKVQKANTDYYAWEDKVGEGLMYRYYHNNTSQFEQHVISQFKENKLNPKSELLRPNDNNNDGQELFCYGLTTWVGFITTSRSHCPTTGHELVFNDIAEIQPSNYNLGRTKIIFSALSMSIPQNIYGFSTSAVDDNLKQRYRTEVQGDPYRYNSNGTTEYNTFEGNAIYHISNADMWSIFNIYQESSPLGLQMLTIAFTTKYATDAGKTGSYMPTTLGIVARYKLKISYTFILRVEEDNQIISPEQKFVMILDASNIRDNLDASNIRDNFVPKAKYGEKGTRCIPSPCP